MSDYPDPDEEYELMYADEIELLKERDDTNDGNILKKKTLPAKRSLDFSSPVSQKPSQTANQANQLTQESKDKNDVIHSSPVLQPLENTQIPVSNKRTAAELFGDIDDIDFDNYEMPSKKQKTEEENDLDLINRIIEGRKMKQILAEPSRIQTNAKSVYEAKGNMSLEIPRWAFIPVTKSNGYRIYVRLESEESFDTSLDKESEKLLLHSTYAAAWEEAQKILEKKQQKEIEQEKPTEEVPSDEHESEVCTDLWVEKYRPHSYIELLSEEPVNRALLHWLHLWDKVVFKKEVKTKEPQQRSSFSKRTGQFQLSNSWRGKKDEPEMDEDGRPHHKVALLCGPPGAGKTTLAHLLARLAGYRPVELNASDERSTDAFRTALQSATLMRSVLDAERRPNCLILDEIDGAPIQTVELLVKWCTATAAKKEDGKKKGKSQPLRRPVIAICNDLYATSLRPLRPIALVVTVGTVSQARLTARLAAVAACERLRVCPRALTALAARAGGDVRAALHVLSFLKARDKSQLTAEDVENAAIGTKDCTKSFMQALQAIFTLNDKDPGSILRTIQAAGEYDRIAEGIFENYLTARADSRLAIAGEVTRWLRLHDVTHTWVQRYQNYAPYGLLPHCLAACHRLLAVRTPHRLRFPLQAQEMARKKAELDSTVEAVWRGSVPGVARRALQRDLLPLLPYLLAPVLRSANVQLCSEAERKTLRACAGAMCDYGLRYVQTRTPDGLYPFVLEPDIYKVAFFGNEERMRPPPAIRQAIAREQQLEIIRRNEEMAGRVTGKPKTKEGETVKPRENKPVEEPKPASKETRLPNHLQRLQPKAVEKSVPQVHKDFFGRIVPLSQVQKQDAVSDAVSSSNVFYQYREGFNNAVRRNVRMKDLL